MKTRICVALSVLGFLLGAELRSRAIYKDTKNQSRQNLAIEENSNMNMNTNINAQQPDTVSIVKLIASPIEYDGKYIRVIGYVSLEFEGTAVYLNQDDYKYGITKNAMWLDIAKSDRDVYKESDQKYALIEGTFDAKGYGHQGLFSGTIKSIKRLMVQE